jgi:hypothetical protein
VGELVGLALGIGEGAVQLGDLQAQHEVGLALVASQAVRARLGWVQLAGPTVFLVVVDDSPGKLASVCSAFHP